MKLANRRKAHLVKQFTHAEILRYNLISIPILNYNKHNRKLVWRLAWLRGNRADAIRELRENGLTYQQALTRVAKIQRLSAAKLFRGLN